MKNDKYAGLDIADIESPEEQAIKVVDKTSTTFKLSGTQNSNAWERASAFFQLYLEPKDSEKLKVTQTIISNYPSKSAGYYYTITRRPDSGAFVYNIECKPGKSYGDVALAKRNARNLARFINSGVLEVSLLSK